MERIYRKAESGWPGDVPREIDVPEIRLDELLARSAVEYPDIDYLYFLNSYYTFKQVNDWVDTVAAALQHDMGVKENDVVAFMLPNCPQFTITYFACQRIGATITSFNPTVKAAEILHYLKGTNSKYLIVLDFLFASPDCLDDGKLLEQTAITRENVIVTNLVDMAHGLSPVVKMLGKLLKKIPGAKVDGPCRQFKDLLATTKKVTPATYDVKTHVAALLFTGGTTGVSKAAMLSTYNMVANTVQCRSWVSSARAGDGIVCVIPTFHSFGQNAIQNVGALLGGLVVLFPKPPETDELLKTLVKVKKQRGTRVFYYMGAEILFKRIADLPQAVIDKYNVKDLFDLCLSAAGALHMDVLESFESKTGARLSEGYGLTEAGPGVSAETFKGFRKVGTLGLPFPSTDWKIVDKETKEDLPGTGLDYQGEIAVAGPQVMLGYLPGSAPDAEEQNMVVFKTDARGTRWLLTGDIGYMDETGRVSITGRLKELIKYKGYSIFPKEVENLMLAHEAISEVAVAGIPDHASGEVVKAYVILKPEHVGKITEKEMLDWAKKNITEYKAPKLLSFRDELPKTLVGKVLRRELQEQDLAVMRELEK